MMTINDIMEQTNIEGAIRVQKWNEDIADNEVLFETEDIRYNNDMPYSIGVKKIEYLYSVNTEMGATIIFEICE